MWRTRRALKKGASQNGPRPFTQLPDYFSQPLQEAQHSAESQHDVVAAFAAPANPSAITANNRTAASFFMDFLL
jgi:hypothetical protein